MADVRLDFYDLDEDSLPDVCMKCGAPAVVRPVKQFSWIPLWARFIPPIIAVWFIKRRRVPIPLCDQHKNHWTMRYLIGIGGFLLLLALFFGGLILLVSNESNDPGGPLSVLGGVLMAGAGVLFLAWLITMIVLAATQINVAEITDDTILLKNVHYDFTQAYREHTRPGIAPEVDDAIRDQWGRPTGRRPAERDDPRRARRDDDYPPDDKYRRG